MGKSRMEAFSDGVIAIVITVMVLELAAPVGGRWAALRDVAPSLLSYLLSFTYLAIYWNNHHMLHAVDRIDGSVLWANLHLLFWLSLVPFVTAWMDRHHAATAPTATYGVVLLLAAVAYNLLQSRLLAANGPSSRRAGTGPSRGRFGEGRRRSPPAHPPHGTRLPAVSRAWRRNPPPHRASCRQPR
ncbi:MAG TPA: TMEM175 family protein [Trueperaceae bacterium]|nr:TMEM175 family protein [Trueperaceae bacterium]